MAHPHILIVDDQQALADLYTRWLDDDYRVTTAYGGTEALEQLDDTVDVVLLDRRMPDMTGDEVLAEIRDGAIDARVAMVTAVSPDFDIFELGFDAYIEKPVDEAILRETIDSLLDRSVYDAQVQEYFSLLSRKAAIEAEKDTGDLEDHDEYEALADRVTALESEVQDTLSNLDEEGLNALFYDV